MKTKVPSSVSRRQFIQAAALAGVALSLPSLKGQSTPEKASSGKKHLLSPDKPFRLACVGCGGMGASDIERLMALNEKGFHIELVALCDVDEERAKKTFEKYPNVPRYKDYRKMLAEKGSEFDAVTISTPDHMHFPIAMAMMNAGKHIYVQKPLAHSIEEVRIMKAKALETGLIAQMGNQGHANDGTRLQQEWIAAGAIGAVKEVVAWTNRPIWPQGIPAWLPGQPVPPTMDWKLWIGVSDFVDYNAEYAPFKWRGYWEWGCGALGDMACHTLDAPFRALDLRGDCTVTAEMRGETPVSFPTGAKVTYEFPERNGRPALKLTWYEGDWKAPVPPELEPSEKDEQGNLKPAQLTPTGGALYYGEKGILYNPNAHSNAAPRLLPKAKMDAFKKNLPPKSIPRIPNSNAYLEWVEACRGSLPCGSDVADTAADLTEIVLLGCLAMRLGNGKTIRWDAKNARVVGVPQADAFIRVQNRSF